MALYSFCQYSIHNIEFVHGFYAISIVYQSMFMFIMSCVASMVRPDVWGWIMVRCAFGLALVLCLAIRRVGDLGAIE